MAPFLACSVMWQKPPVRRPEQPSKSSQSPANRQPSVQLAPPGWRAAGASLGRTLTFSTKGHPPPTHHRLGQCAWPCKSRRLAGWGDRCPRGSARGVCVGGPLNQLSVNSGRTRHTNNRQCLLQGAADGLRGTTPHDRLPTAQFSENQNRPLCGHCSLCLIMFCFYIIN